MQLRDDFYMHLKSFNAQIVKELVRRNINDLYFKPERSCGNLTSATLTERLEDGKDYFQKRAEFF